MALSDSCLDFLLEFKDAAAKLAKDVHWYSAPDYPLQYGEEIDALRRACLAVEEEAFDPEAGSKLLALAASVVRYHFGPIDGSEEQQRWKEMHKLIKLLQANLDADDADAVPATVENDVKESSQTEQATSRLNLTKSLYSQRFSVTLVLPATNIGMQMTADAAPHAG